MLPEAETIIHRLDSARQRWWFCSLLSDCVLVAGVSLALILICILGDAFLLFSPSVVRMLLFGWLCATAGMLLTAARLLLRNLRSLEAAARRVESELPELGDNLINLVQLSEQRCSGEPAFAQAAIRHATEQVNRISFDAALKKESRLKRLRYCLQTPRDLAELLVLFGAMICALMICKIYVPNWDSSARRMFSPWSYVPSVGKAGVIEVTPGDAHVLLGDGLQIVARIENPQGEIFDASIFIQPEGEEETRLSMASDPGRQQYKYAFSTIEKLLRYRVEIGGSQTPFYTIKVYEKPSVARLKVTYCFPDYLKRKEETVSQKTADLEAPQYSTALLRIEPSTAVSKGFVRMDGRQIFGRVEEDGKLLRLELPLLKNSSFTIHLFNKAGLVDPEPRINRIHVIADRAPSAELIKPPAQSTATLGAKSAVLIRAGDDYGIGGLRLEMKVSTAAGIPATVLKKWNDFEYTTATTRRYDLELNADKFRVGQAVFVRAVVSDKRSINNWGLQLQAQESDSAWHELKIVDELRKFPDGARVDEKEFLSQLKRRPGGDLPEEVKQKLREAREKLDKFLKEQKKIIEASENLAKTPVDDFTQQEAKQLEALAAAEDDWSKFMRELFEDLSKLPEQDFANPSSVKDAIEIQTELKMAADALLKKTVDIAVPLEQLGYEMAEEMKTNIEKWLPDSPDREKWSQEESLSDKDKEAPMAELPGELEDMIGELMEQEEDLFDEMEDVSSSAADSLDKGAGWDTLDGPISNMSARGVTGNRLPNTSEIGGRAGEGRQGKSSGEFVGNEAVGKGGRKTPSRLTPDPFVKGQIKDRDKQVAGGATGGGKQSGLGGEGLEGPAPRATNMRDPQRLAAKQATLRNKAEGIDLQMKVMHYNHVELKKMIEIMARIELDIKSGRYKNALRQRPVLA
ncbi:MAG: hypothetical protein ACWGMZ_08730, partial [Thermoguttaceae bacterium]